MIANTRGAMAHARSLLLIMAAAACMDLRAQDSTRIWSMEAGVMAILYHDTIALINPSLNADRGKLHLEGRYQWEDWRTGSVWAGRWFHFGDALSVSVAPMVGVVFGYTNGIAPGYTLDASWKSLALYSSSEYVIGLEDDANDFMYTWTELTLDLDQLFVGVVVQRTRTFNSPLDLQRGFILQREQGDFTFGMYLFNAFWTDPTVTLTLSYAFDVPPQRKPSSTPEP